MTIHSFDNTITTGVLCVVKLVKQVQNPFHAGDNHGPQDQQLQEDPKLRPISRGTHEEGSQRAPPLLRSLVAPCTAHSLQCMYVCCVYSMLIDA